MAQFACSRCFTVFDAEDVRPGAAPLCAACAPRATATAPLRAASRATALRSPRSPRRGVARAIAAVAIVVLAAAGAAAFLLVRREPPPPPPPDAVEARLEAWREAGILPAARARDAGLAAARLEAGAAALAADLPVRTAEALRAFREALALSPRRSDAAIAGYANAFADAAGEDADGTELRGTHEMVRAALADGARPELQTAYARLLLVVPGEANAAEARAVAARAVPAAAARILEEAAAAAPSDRRLLTAAARARWAAGDAAGAIALADRRLALDPGHPASLALRADVLTACDRLDDGRATLERWAAADPGSPLPPLLLARIAYQRDDDLAGARRLLDAALARRPDDFVAARALAHRAAIELASGDVSAAEVAVRQALAR